MVLIALTDASLNETLPPAHVWGEEHNTLVGRVLTGWTTALAGCLSWDMGFALVGKVQRAAVGPHGAGNMGPPAARLLISLLSPLSSRSRSASKELLVHIPNVEYLLLAFSKTN